MQLENKSLKSQLQSLTTKHEQDIETTRREERLLLSTMYEVSTESNLIGSVLKSVCICHCRCGV
jgi:hypothetical protein